MPLLLEKDGLQKCAFCNNRAEYKCAVCGSFICDFHYRYGRLYGYNISPKNEYYCMACWRVERNNIKKTVVTKLNLISSLKKIGLEEGDAALVQSSVSAFGTIDNGAETIIDVISLCVGETGAIVMPSFTHSQESFHMRATKVDANYGILPELLRRRAKTTRSNNHPLSFVSLGKNAVYFINNAVKYDSIDEFSPVRRVMEKGGKLLMLGVEFNNCLPVLYADTTTHKNRKKSCGKKYHIIGNIAAELESYKEIMIGEALCRIMSVKELVDAVSSRLASEPNLFNCYNNFCAECMSSIKINNALFEKNKLK